MKSRIALIILFGCSLQVFPTENNVSDARVVDNPYDVLGLPRNCVLEDITQTYRRLIRRFHPDRRPNTMTFEEANRHSAAINGAFDILNNSALRRDYDQLGHILQATVDHEAPGFEGEIITTNWGWFKQRFSHSVENHIKSISYLILCAIGTSLGKKLYNRELKSDKLLKKLIKNYHLFGSAVSEKIEQKELDKKLKELKNKILTTQLSLIKDNLDQTQKDKLQKRLDKYLKEAEAVQDEIDELSQYYHDDFNDVLKNINK